MYPALPTCVQLTLALRQSRPVGRRGPVLYRKTRHSGRPVYALSQPTGSLYRVTTRSMLWAAGGVAAVALMLGARESAES